MSNNYFTYSHAKQFPMLRSVTPTSQKHFLLRESKRSPVAKNSRHVRGIIMRKMNIMIEERLKLLGERILKDRQTRQRKISSIYQEPYFSTRKKVILHNVSHFNVRSKDILEVSINDFEPKPGLSPQKSFSQSQLKKDLSLKAFSMSPEKATPNKRSLHRLRKPFPDDSLDLHNKSIN
mmetsp:Transcript_2653/g.4144  ORF Transcript_2653/g.4144 Transcript_2653/m.4144 type:complete len:178 (-) Transcript_2653:10-543(-)